MGLGSILLGANIAQYRIWDGMRAIDYLQSREDIRVDKIGCTGNSGGGTLTAYLMALDDRILAAAPVCYLTTFRKLIDTRGAQDAEQNIFGQIAFGMDEPDYVILRAPKPTLICAGTRDATFDIEGTWELFRQAKRFYARLGFAEGVDLIEADAPHGFTIQQREAAARWMRRWLLGIDDAITEPEFPVAADEALWCTPRGEVMLLDGARSVYDLNAELEEKLAAERKSFWEASEKAKALDAVRRISGIRRLSDLPEPKWEKRGEVRREGYRIEKIVLQPDGAIPIAALLLVPDEPASGATLYLDAEGKQKEAAPGGALEQLARGGQIVLAPDLCGLGEDGPGRQAFLRRLPPARGREATIAYLLENRCWRCVARRFCSAPGFGGVRRAERTAPRRSGKRWPRRPSGAPRRRAGARLVQSGHTEKQPGFLVERGPYAADEEPERQPRARRAAKVRPARPREDSAGREDQSDRPARCGGEATLKRCATLQQGGLRRRLFFR